MKLLLFSLVALAMLFNISFAQLGFDRTRLILDQSQYPTATINISNPVEKKPYLAKTWIEDENHIQITSGIVAMPVLQRLDPNESKLVTVRILGDISHVSKDRETLFYFNILPIPTVKNSNSMEFDIILQTQIKLFYRPKGLPKYKAFSGWANDVSLTRSGNNLTLENPTPYHLVIKGFSRDKGSLQSNSLLLKPFSKELISTAVSKNFKMHIINDYGLLQILEYDCGSSNGKCHLTKGIPDQKF